MIRRAAAWFGASTNRRILGAAATIGVLTLLTKVGSFVKDLAVAYRFGTGDAVDAYLVALVLPTFAINVVANSLNAAFMAVYVEARERRSTAEAGRLFEGVLGLSTVILLAATLVLLVAPPVALPWLASGFGPAKLAQTERLFYMLLPIVLLSGMATVYTAALNAAERFALGAVAPMLVPVAVLGALILAGDRVGVDALATGTVVGYLLNVALVARAVSAAGLSVLPRWHGWTPELRRVVSQYVPVAVGGCLMSGTALVDQAMAAMLAGGSVAALSYGNKVIALFTGLGTMALGTAVLPHFSSMAALAEWAAIRHTLRTWIRLILLTTVPLTVGLVLLSRIVVELAFERGAFSSTDTTAVAFVQRMYVLQIPFYTLGILFVRMLTSLQRNETLLWGTAISFPLKIILNLTLMPVLGVAGIALSTSLVYLASAAYLGLALRRALSKAERAAQVPVFGSALSRAVP
jgi:putative peptidoglycan lipid II flippase